MSKWLLRQSQPTSKQDSACLSKPRQDLTRQTLSGKELSAAAGAPKKGELSGFSGDRCPEKRPSKRQSLAEMHPLPPSGPPEPGLEPWHVPGSVAGFCLGAAAPSPSLAWGWPGWCGFGAPARERDTARASAAQLTPHKTQQLLLRGRGKGQAVRRGEKRLPFFRSLLPSFFLLPSSFFLPCGLLAAHRAEKEIDDSKFEPKPEQKRREEEKRRKMIVVLVF